MGVVKHDVNISAGSSGLSGNHSPCDVGHKTIVSRIAGHVASTTLLGSEVVSPIFNDRLYGIEEDTPDAPIVVAES